MDQNIVDSVELGEFKKVSDYNLDSQHSRQVQPHFIEYCSPDLAQLGSIDEQYPEEEHAGTNGKILAKQDDYDDQC